MKVLSGYFLSRVLELFGRANRDNMPQEEIISSMTSIVKTEGLWVDIEGKSSEAASIDSGVLKGQRQLDPTSLATLNCMLPWSSYNQLEGGSILGSAYRGDKRAAPHRIPDPHVKMIQKLCGLPDGFSALEMGCFEGHYTTSLALVCGKVYALDSRVENVVKTLVRCWMLGVERSVSVDVVNLESPGLAQFYRRRYGADSIDLIHHRGVLYHLADPVGHLSEVSKFCAKYLYLHTQYADPNGPLIEYKTALGTYNAFSFNERSVAYAPFAGMVPQAIWLKKKDLIDVLSRLGFVEFKELYDRVEKNGPRVELIAAKPGARFE